MGKSENYVLLACLNKVQEELFYYPGIGVSVGIGVGVGRGVSRMLTVLD